MFLKALRVLSLTFLVTLLVCFLTVVLEKSEFQCASAHFTEQPSSGSLSKLSSASITAAHYRKASHEEICDLLQAYPSFTHSHGRKAHALATNGLFLETIPFAQGGWSPGCILI